jgi:Carboxypeptidase regulatory-like domain/TonB dependent receptor-like, beta-barrel
MLFLKRLAFLMLSLCLLTSMAVQLWAQSDRGTITGTVTDATGGVVAGASITATNSNTGVSSKTISGANGNYTIPLLRVGTYTVTAEQPGFKKLLRQAVTVPVGQTVHLDLALEVGEVTQSVEVQAEAPQLRPDTSDLGTVISSQQVEDLPLVGVGEQRSPAIFMILAPGVTGRGQTYLGSAAAFGERHWSTTVSGSQSGAFEFHLEGSIIAQPGEASSFRTLGFPQDAVGEFKITSINAPAEYGRSAAGFTSFTLKSGDNQLHGSLYEYLRNDALDARGFFTPKAKNKQNEFGFTVGGPIHKDKTFFFGWYNGFRVVKGASGHVDTVPTAEEKQGNLSAYLNLANQIGTDALGRPVYQGAVYDPATTRTVAAGAVDQGTGLTNTSGTSAVLRDAFGATAASGWTPTNIIPSNRFDAVSAKILPLFEPPNLPGIRGNLSSSFVDNTRTNQWGTKIDHAISDRNKINGSFLWARQYTPGFSPYTGPLTNAIPSSQDIRILRLSEDLIARPNLVNHVTFGFNRTRSGTIPGPEALGWPAQIGLTGVNEAGVFPGLNIADQGNTYGNTGINYSADNNFDVNETLTWIKGRHTAKFGFEYLKMQYNTLGFGRDAGYFSFAYGETALPGFPQTLTGTGNGLGSFLLGQVDAGNVNTYTGGTYERSGYYSLYAQDDFKLSPKLTINYGIRYELYLPTVEKFNNMSWVDRTTPNPGAGNYPGAVVFATSDRRSPTEAFTKAFAPRLGLAYRINDKTVLRASYGIFYGAGGYVRAIRGQYNQGVTSSSNSLTTPDQGITPAFVFDEGWPASNPNFTYPPSKNPAYGLTGGPRMLDPTDARPPDLQNWTLNLQRELPGQILFDVAYVGNKGTHLPSRLLPTNQMSDQYLSLGSQLFTNVGDPSVQALSVVQALPVDPATGHHVPFTGFESIWGAGATLGQALRPFPQYGTEDFSHQMRRFFEGVGVSNYQALQVKVNKRFSQGLTFLASYTWSKTLTDAESQASEFSGFLSDAYNRKAEKSYSINDYPHNLVLSYSYELPFGPGKKFANAGGAAGKILGGWKVAGIQQYQSGGPNMIFVGNPLWPLEGSNGFSFRPSIVPGVPQKSPAVESGNFQPNVDSLVNSAAFRSPDPFTFGDASRTLGSVRRFSYLNEDISIIKRTQITERVSVDFRADFLNAFNRTVFGLGTGGDQYGTLVGSGLINSQSNVPREIQFGLKINY